MKATTVLTVLTSVLILGPVANATTISIEASDNATVQPAGPRSGTSGKNFFNIEGSNNNAFASLGVIDFNFGALAPPLGGAVTGINSVSLQMTQSNAGFSMAGPLSIYLTDQTGVDIQPGNTPAVVYQAGNNGAASVDPDLLPLTLLGSGTYTVVENGTVDSYALTFSGPAITSLLDALNNDTTLRLIVTPDDAATAATYAGFTNNTFAGPTLVIDATIIPEPGSYVLFALGAAVCIAGRRRSDG